MYTHLYALDAPLYYVDVIHLVSATYTIAFITYLPFRLRELKKSHFKASWDWQGPIKFCLAICLSIIATVLLADSQGRPVLFFVSNIASLVAALVLSLLLILEHYRSVRPSDLATLYLLSSTFGEGILITVPQRRKDLSNLLIVRLCTSLLILIMECNKRTSRTLARSPEETNGFLSMIFFTWINPILLRGYKNILMVQDLPPLDENMKPQLTRMNLLQMWDRRAKPETKASLPLALFRAMKWPFLVAIVPRLALIIFRYCQPVLIKESIRFVVSSPDTSSDYGCWLIVSALTIYICLAVSISMYQHRLNKLKLLIKSSLVGLIHEKTMNSPSISYDNGESTTLMSTDTDSLDGIAEMFHETWAQILEVVVGLVLLAREVGWIWPLPLLLIFLCSRVSRYVSKHLQSRQKAWNNATQSRVAATSSMLGSMKTIKILGLQEFLTNRILDLRKEELSVAARLRWMMVYYNASANALGIFTPAITLALFAVIAAIQGRKLDTETAFTTIAILSMVTHPANMVMTIVPRAIGTLAAFDRIQKFLLRPSLHDYRLIIDDTPKLIESESNSAILIQNMSLATPQPVLEDMNLSVAAGEFVIIAGPVSSGKSSLLRAILGEIPLSHGAIELSTKRIAYCGQRPWLPNGSIRDAIIGSTGYNDIRFYEEVVAKCRLTHDLNSLPGGDETQIGSRGMNLSGGQRQRVALARALYARCNIVLLDDTFSGLDGGTEHQVFLNLFDSAGLFKSLKTTVILVTNSTQYFQSADKVILLGSHGIEEQGQWQHIKLNTRSITKVDSHVHVQAESLSSSYDKLGTQLQARNEAKVDLSRQTGDIALYGYYFRFAGWNNILWLIGLTTTYSFFITVPQYWIELWTRSDSDNSVFFICGFLLLALVSWSSTSASMWATLIRLAPCSGSRLQKRLLHIVTNAPLSFFSKTDNGSILNRFSQDIQLIDKQLPTAFSSLAVQTSKLLMQAILLSITQWWLALSLPACLVVLWIIQKAYLRTSRQLRFLELESRAAVFSSFLETIEGIETIRSFNWCHEIIQQNILRVENSQRPEYLLLCLQRWLNIVLDLLAAAIASSVVAAAVLYRGQISGGQVGVALNIMLVANTTLLKLVENWTQLEISLGAVARVRSFEETTPSEGGGKRLEPPENWPSEGRVELKNVTASYGTDSVVLRNVSINIQAGQKVVICGRTGSGKSSLFLTFLRILELQHGKIEVDGINISQSPLNILREQCFITVPQDAFLLPNNTLRQNLDHDSSLTDEAIIQALQRTELLQHFHFHNTSSNTNYNSILNTPLCSLPELSTGQAQLFALCRAVLRAYVMRAKGVQPIILLDEVTSSLDYASEALIYRVLDEEFTERGHTVIMIAHRVGALIDCLRDGRDVVVVMGDGEVCEVITGLTSDRLRVLGEGK